MIPTIIKTDSISQPSRTGSVAPITPVTAIADPPESAPDFTQGHKYQAIVETRLHNGNARVSIAGHLLQMQLPDNIPAGNKIELIFIAREPQYKFLLHNELSPGNDKNSLNISNTGRVLSSLVQNIMQSTSLTPLPSTSPIVTNPLINSTQLPGLLQKALTRSGLFYESHLAQWVAGKNTLTQLQQEPQSKLTIATMTTLAPSDIDIVVHTQSLPLVQQQLSALETGHLIWRGEIWPNQLMEWDISDHSSSGHEPVTDEVSSHWQMQLSMTLPKLGEVTANIVINANCMHIRLHTAATETAEFLRNNRPPLATAIASTGLSVQSVEIHANDNE